MPAMEKLMLSSASNFGEIYLNKYAAPLAVNLSLRNSSKVYCLNLSRVSGFKGFRVSSQSGLVEKRAGLRVGGWRDDALLMKTFVAASGEESVSTDLQVEGKVVEGLKDTDGGHETTRWNGERKGFENSDTEPFDSLRNSIEELQREVDKAKESLADVSKETTEKEENKPQEPKKAAKIHDFCFGIPYGGLLIGIGSLGFLISGSMSSVLCFVAGGAVLGLSLTSLKVWRQGKSCTPFILGQAVFSFILLAGHLREFSLTKVFPTGFTAVISALMLSFYTYVYSSGGNPPSKKLKVSSVSQVS